MIISVNNQEEAERFNHGDPFYRLNVWDEASIRIQPFIKRRGWSGSPGGRHSFRGGSTVHFLGPGNE